MQYTHNDSLSPDGSDLVSLSVLIPGGTTEFPDNVTSTSCYDNWLEPNHVLYQVAHVILFAGFLAPTSNKGLLVLHCCCIVGFLLLSCWSWLMLCAPDIFSWMFSLVVINVVQVAYILYHLRPVNLPPDLAQVYTQMFAPLKVTKTQFKHFVAKETSTIHTLQQGEPYATQEITKTDRLSLLLCGTVNVVSNGQFLHQIQEKQFLDSPEFESSTNGEEKFHVSIVAATPCKYLTWSRQSLQVLFPKEPYVALVLGHILGRDITNKLYLLNERLKTQKGSRVDIRLPNVSSAALSGVDLRDETRLRSGSDLRSDTDEDDILDEVSEKMPMFPNGVPHGKLNLHLSSSTFSSVSSR